MNGKFVVNSKECEFSFESDTTLLSVLRDNGFTEVKRGCDAGECGACVVLVDGEIVNSCQVYAASVMGSKITTVKGLGDFNNPHPIQKAFVDAGAVQCGFCTPGMVLSTFSLLQKIPSPSVSDIKKGLDGNFCRCTGYVKIIKAVQLAAERLR